MDTQTLEMIPPSVITLPQEQDPFYYGFRWVMGYDADTGEDVWTQVPLTLQDFLDPQEGDHFMQGTLHEKDTDRARGIFRYLHRNDPGIAVFSDLKMKKWGPGLSEPAPDVAVIPNVRDPDKPRGVFDVRKEGVCPSFVLEIVSPRYRKSDWDEKVVVYARAGVEEYFIIDSGLRESSGEDVWYEVVGYRLQRGRYVEIQPNDRGWVYSAVNDVWVGPNEARDGFVVIDGQTGERILPDDERAEVAEIQAAIEATARMREAAARAEAEHRAQVEAAARAEAERQVQEMKAELARLRAIAERR